MSVPFTVAAIAFDPIEILGTTPPVGKNRNVLYNIGRALISVRSPMDRTNG